MSDDENMRGNVAEFDALYRAEFCMSSIGIEAQIHLECSSRHIRHLNLVAGGQTGGSLLVTSISASTMKGKAYHSEVGQPNVSDL
jgi:hypothetical protein